MKKPKFIAVILVLSVILMGSGYAYWQEILTIDTTIDTGCLDLQFQPISIRESGDYDDGDSNWHHTNLRDYDGSDYMDVSVTPDDNNHILNCTFSNIYPGAGGFISFKIINTGTIPAKLAGVTDEITEETIEGLRDEFNYNIQTLLVFKKDDPFNPIIVPCKRASSYVDFVKILNNMMKEYILEPGDYIELGSRDYEHWGYNIEMPFGDTENNELEKQTFSFKLKLHFEQVK